MPQCNPFVEDRTLVFESRTPRSPPDTVFTHSRRSVAFYARPFVYAFHVLAPTPLSFLEPIVSINRSELYVHIHTRSTKKFYFGRTTVTQCAPCTHFSFTSPFSSPPRPRGQGGNVINIKRTEKLVVDPPGWRRCMYALSCAASEGSGVLNYVYLLPSFRARGIIKTQLCIRTYIYVRYIYKRVDRLFSVCIINTFAFLSLWPKNDTESSVVVRIRRWLDNRFYVRPRA